MFLEESLKIKELALIGVDEVGRGPLAGPVVSCACFYEGSWKTLSETFSFLKDLGVTDSKKLTPKKRETILKELGVDISTTHFDEVSSFQVGNCSFRFCLSEINPEQIDEINILQASLMAMVMATKPLLLLTDFQREPMVWIDGNKIPAPFKENKQTEAIVKGDSKSLIIALASIIAKEKRDLLMKELAVKYPGYGFEKHAGYPTKSHKEAVATLGVSPVHRKTFKGVKEFVSY